MTEVILNVVFLETNKGGRQFIWNCYTYRHDNKRDTWISWKCVDNVHKRRRTDKAGQCTQQSTRPNCSRGQKDTQCHLFRSKTELKPIPSIDDEEISKWMPRPGKQLQNYQLLTLKWRRCTEHAKNTLPSIPSTRTSIQIDGKFRLTTSQEQYLQADDGDIDKIQLCSTTENILHLCAAETIYCYGTFYTAPPILNQIFNIHAYVGDVMLPLVFSLQPKRDTATYNRLFAILKDIASRHNLNFSPRRVSLDLECVSRNAAAYTFPTTELQGCLFHYAKAIWRKTQECGLQTDNEDVFNLVINYADI